MEAAWPYGSRCSTSRRPQEPSHAPQYLPDRRRTQHPAPPHRRAPAPDWRLRAHILLLLADGWAWATIAALLYTSSSTIARWQRRFRQGRLAAVFPAGAPRRPVSAWVAVVVRWVLELAPADFGFARS